MNKKELRKAINEEKRNVSLKDIALSSVFSEYIANGIKAIFDSHNRSAKLKAEIIYDEQSSITAFTDNHKYCINAGNPLFSKERIGTNAEGDPIYLDQSLSTTYKILLGTLFHEIGHVLYTNFAEFKIRHNMFSKGEFSVNFIDLTSKEKDALNEINSLINDKHSFVLVGSGVKTKNFIATIFKQVNNMVEDGRIENILLKNDSHFGGYCEGLQLLREKHEREMDDNLSYEKDIATYCNMILQYAKFHNLRMYDGNFPEIEQAKPVIDEMLNCHQSSKFADYTMKLILIAWERLIKPLITEMDGDDEQDDNEQEQADNSEQSEDNSENNESGGSSESDSSSESGGSSNGKSGSKEKADNKIDDLTNKIGNMNQSVTPDYENSQKPVSIDQQKMDGEIQDSEGSMTPDLLKNVAKEMMEKRLQEESAKQIKSDSINHIPFCLTPEEVVVKSDINIPPNANHILRDVDDQIKSKVQKIAREIERHLQADMRTRVSKRKFSGKKFHAEKVVNRDFRYFENVSTQKDTPKVAVALCVDESGSMSCSGRFEYARNAAIALYKMFERIDNLDIAIYGHSTGFKNVVINNYLDFGFNKPKDAEKRLTSIAALYGNVDIIPITAMSENLLRQDAEIKMLFIISDGRPHSPTGNPEKELREAVEHYRKQGIEIFIASIGDDRTKLATIYQNEHFLDISNVKDLPMKLLNVIKRKF